MMNGYEALKEEMYKRGLSKSQVESTAAAMVLSILAEKPEIMKMFDISRDIGKLQRKKEKMLEDIKRTETELYKARHDMQEVISDYKLLKTQAMQETEEYIQKFLEVLESCETEEGRDLIRTAQMFVNSVDVNTKYDNTAFIIGMATILSKGAINGIDELKKINPNVAKERGRRL